MTDREFIEGYFSDMRTVVDRVCRDDIARAIELLFEAWKKKRRIFIIGNGGSASTATHFAADLNKTAIVKDRTRFKALALVDNIPLCSALVNDEGFECLFIEQMKNFFEPGDVVVAISVHGGSGQDNAGVWSQNLLKAVQYAHDNGGQSIGFSGFDGGSLKKLATVCCVVPIDSTPQVESFHVALEHLIVNCLREKIRDEA